MQNNNILTIARQDWRKIGEEHKKILRGGLQITAGILLVIIFGVISDQRIIEILYFAKAESLLGQLFAAVAENAYRIPLDAYVEKSHAFLVGLLRLYFAAIAILAMGTTPFLFPQTAKALWKRIHAWAKRGLLETPEGELTEAKAAKRYYALAFVLLGIFLALAFTSSQKMSLTVDEPKHYRYGRQLLEGDSNHYLLLDESKMPFSALNALPAEWAKSLPKSPVKEQLQAIETGRIATMIAGAALGYVIFHWARVLYGFIPGLMSLALYTFDPNILAHTGLITTDIYAALTITLAAYFFWRFLTRRTPGYALASAITLGTSQLAKYTSIFLYMIFGLIALSHELPKLTKLWRANHTGGLLRYAGRAAQFGVIFLLASLLIINIGFLFNDSLKPLGAYEFQSDLFSNFQARTSLFEGFPIPLPAPYIEGLDQTRFHERTGASFGRIYLLGDLRDTGFEGYFIYASLFKVPIATHIIIFAAIIAYFRKGNLQAFRDKELFLWWPVIFFFLYFNFFFQAQIGIRFILLIFPFLFIFCGRLLTNLRSLHDKKVYGISALLVYLAVSGLSYHPHYLAYFNEFVWDRRSAYKILADSNLDWGQGQYYLEEYLSQNPEAVFAPEEPTTGKIIVPVNELVGIVESPQKYAWLRENFEPVDTIAHAYLVYISGPEN